jgi:SAM-dependent methyltransferase
MVDFVGSASNLDVSVAEKNLLGTFDYVVSSHNLEHIPDPLRFLQACQKVLKPGGTISFALPDRRAGGDYLRGPSTTGEVLEAWWQKRVHPSPAQIFAHVSMNVSNTGLSDQARWRVRQPVTGLESTSSIHEAMRIAREHVEDRLTEYFDAHCWVFTPASIRLLIEDLRALGLTDLSIRKIVSNGGHEFFVHLVNDATGAGSPATTMTPGERVALILDIAQETARLG